MVGNGDNIIIGSDPWLPVMEMPHISFDVCMEIRNAKVSSLFESHRLTWDRDLINDVFNERDATIILGGPFS